MNAADYYGLDELRRACAGFVQSCITVDTVCALLASAERYIQYKCTKSLVQKVIYFFDMPSFDRPIRKETPIFFLNAVETTLVYDSFVVVGSFFPNLIYDRKFPDY